MREPFTDRWSSAAPVIVILVGVISAAVVLVGLYGGSKHVIGQAEPASPHTTTAPTAGDQAQPGWDTLRNPVAGLSYQLPPTGWTVRPPVSPAGSVALSQGAVRDPYVCGTPAEELLRGMLGSGSAPAVDPAGLATSIASAAIGSYYRTGNDAPQVQLDPPQPVRRTGSGGRIVTGAMVRARATQHADPCLASSGETLVLVLRFADHDGVFVINGDLGGGPGTPVPSTDQELQTIVNTVEPST